MKLIFPLRRFAKAPKDGGRITLTTYQTGFGREPIPGVRLLCVIYVRTSLEKERNGPKKKGRKRENVLYLKLHHIFVTLLVRTCVKGTHLRQGTISMECVIKNAYDHNRELVGMSPALKK